MSIATLVGCARFAPPTVPMASISDRRGPTKAKCLLVFLPGIGDHAAAFRSQRFVDLVRQRPLSVDIVAADATFAYYRQSSLVERLATDVIGPATRAGYAETWLGGISLGGLGALLYARERPADVTGVLALSPFLGEDDLIEEIQAAGGLSRWTPPAPQTGNYQRDLWLWLRDVTSARTRGPDLYLGWGNDDRFRVANALLGQTLPTDHVLRAPGKHDWNTWRRLFGQWLEQSTFASRCVA